MTENMKFVIKTSNPLLLKLLHDQINKMLKKKFKKEMKEGKAMLVVSGDKIELMSTDPGLSREFEKSFKKNNKGMAKLMQKGVLAKMYGDFKMELVPC